jgi:hypothetical protein
LGFSPPLILNHVCLYSCGEKENKAISRSAHEVALIGMDKMCHCLFLLGVVVHNMQELIIHFPFLCFCSLSYPPWSNQWCTLNQHLRWRSHFLTVVPCKQLVHVAYCLKSFDASKWMYRLFQHLTKLTMSILLIFFSLNKSSYLLLMIFLTDLGTFSPW